MVEKMVYSTVTTVLVAVMFLIVVTGTSWMLWRQYALSGSSGCQVSYDKSLSAVLAQRGLLSDQSTAVNEALQAALPGRSARSARRRRPQDVPDRHQGDRGRTGLLSVPARHLRVARVQSGAGGAAWRYRDLRVT